MPIEYVYEDRLAVVQDFLRPLRNGGEVACAFVPGQASKGIVIATWDEYRSDRDYTERRFRALPANGIWYNYYEIWREIDANHNCILFRAYFHVYRADEQRQLLPFACLHSDPNEVPTDPNDAHQVRVCRYKRGPHLHVLRADEPMPSCHFPLNLGHLDAVLASAASITDAIRTGIDLIHYEMVSRWTKL
jgi:hypothetical protein